MCPILEDFSWAMANTVIPNTKVLNQGPAQSCACIALANSYYLFSKRSALSQ